MLLEIMATLSAGLFAGAAIYIDLAEQPARRQIDTSAALAEWRPSYKRAAVVQPLLAGIGFLSAVAAWLMGASVWWLVGAVLLVAVIPYTLIVVLPTNNKLLDPTIDKDPDSGAATADPLGKATHAKKRHERSHLSGFHVAVVTSRGLCQGVVDVHHGH